MAKSFVDNLKEMQALKEARIQNGLEKSTVTTYEANKKNDFLVESIDPTDIPTLVTTNTTTYANTNGTFTKSDKYLWYNEYKDENYSTVDEDKNITINPKQINLTQESNSQFIPFMMDRYYDGVDLMGKTLLVVFENKDGQGEPITPINVEYNTNKIRFGLLATKNFTAVEGEVKIEIQAIGSTSKGDEYIFKTRSGSLNIEKSLAGNGIIEPDGTWMTSFITQITEKVAEAEDAARTANTLASRAEESAQLALQAAADSQITIDQAKTELSASVEQSVKDNITTTLLEYYTKAEVDEIIENIDISEQLKELEDEIDNIDGLVNFDVDYREDEKNLVFYNGEETIKSIALNTNPSIEWVTAYGIVVDGKITEAITPIISSLEEYETATDLDLKSIHENIDALPETLKTQYYDKTVIDNKITTVEQSVNTNKKNITTVGTKLSELEDEVAKIDKEPRKTYEITKDEETEMNVLWEIENEGLDTESRVEKSRFTGGGGNGSGGTSSTIKIEYVTKSPLVVTSNDRAIIKYNFSGQDSSGDEVLDGTYTWVLNKKTIATGTAVSGENTFDATDFISTGTQKLTLRIMDDAGSLATKTWTVQKVDVRIESSFNDKLTYPLGDISFDYTPYGAIEKTIHFRLDTQEIGTVNTSSSGIPMAYTLPPQSHGAHLLEVYITAEVNNSTIETNHVYKDIIWYDSNSNIPVIGCTSKYLTIKQYDTANIIYSVYDPNTDIPTVVLAVDGKTVSTITMDENTKTWQYKTSDVGNHVLTITCGEVVKTINVEVEELDIEVSPVTAGLEFDFNPSGYSNDDVNRLWSDENKDVSMVVSDNFDWQNGGYQIDENGDQYFCVKAGTTATIGYKLFADDPKKTGKEFKVVFKTTNVKNRSASFLKCMDNNNIGLDMKIESAYIYSSNDSLYSPYCEDDIIEFEFNINKNTDIPMVLTYEDGVGNRPMIYTSDASFMQANPQSIIIGSEDCDVYIYRMKAYSSSLTDRNILSNFIADARNAEEMINRYNRNQIYDENGALDPYVLAEKCPDLRIILVDCPRFTTDKSDKVSGTNITMIYKNGDPVLDNWTCTGAQHSGQGTSSNEYGYSGRNLDLIMNGDDALFTFGDGETTAKTVTFTRESTPIDYMNVKVNIASSENENNAQMTMRFNQYQPYIRPARLVDSKKRDCMAFYNCIVFVREYNEDLSTHNEFNDYTDYHYYALGNIGDSKKTDSTRVFDKNDPKEFCIEVMDYNVALAEFPTGYTDSEGNETVCPESEWKEGNVAYDYLYAEYKYKDGKFKSFGSESYEFRYEKNGITESERQENIDAWREAYKFIVTSDDNKFKNDFDKYFVKDSILYFYLFTERYLLIDNRAKNLFIQYAKAYFTKEEAAQFKTDYGIDIQDEYIDDGQASFNDGYRFNLTQGYDFDSCLGISNTGELVLTYGQEDVDYYVDGDPSSGYVYRAAESNFFCRVRDLFKSELEAMFVDRESAGAWSASGLISQWDTAQSQFPEEIWRLDIQRKYYRTYQGISIDNSIVPKTGAVAERFLKNMLNGRKKYQRRMFERNQELYMATKYFGNTATQDQIMMRFNNPANKETDFTLYLTPYSDMYIGVKFGNFTPVNFRAKAGKQYTIPYTLDAADITLIFGASFIQEIGDLSKCYVGDNDFSKASRLKSLSIGSGEEGYSNGFMSSIGLGSNKLLEYLDIRNVTGLNTVIDLSNCNNLRELYAQGSGATGAIFSNGGKLQKAYLPSIISLTTKNLNNIEVFDIESLDNLQSLVVENTPFLNTYNMVTSANKLNILRLVGINWGEDYHLETSAILDRLLGLRGIGNDGYETSVSSISGSFYSAIMKQKDLENYQSAWKNLEISYGTLIEQFKVEFVNEDGTVLDVQYIDKGGTAIDPLTRENNPISTPTKDSSISTDYTFAGWDASFAVVFGDQKYTATYTESTREYTVRYLSKGVVKQSSTALYGSYVDYTEDIPTYTAEETAYKYYFFTGWDKSGFVDGNKDINAVFDSCVYSAGYFDNKNLREMRPVEIYAMCKLGLEESVITDKDQYSFKMGYDVEYDDVESIEIISDKKQFNGTNYYDSEVTLFDEDKSFTLAIDYEFLTGTSTRGVLAQCFQSNGSNGFKLWYNSGVKMAWGTATSDVSSLNKREMIILRHKKGDQNLYIYNSALDDMSISMNTLKRTKDTVIPSTLVFGAAKADDGMFESYAVGNIYWCKLWYEDLGEDTCKKLAGWTKEEITLEACGFRKYYLTENSSKRCSFSLLANHLLSRTRMYNNSSASTGGWSSSNLRTYLNERFYTAMPTDMKQLVKQVKIPSSIGDKSTEVVTSDAYVAVPSYIEVDPSVDTEPYIYEGSSISYMTSNSARTRCFDGGDANAYWLRSPNAGYAAYIFTVDNTGKVYGYNLPTFDAGICIEVSI